MEAEKQESIEKAANFDAMLHHLSQMSHPAMGAAAMGTAGALGGYMHGRNTEHPEDDHSVRDGILGGLGGAGLGYGAGMGYDQLTSSPWSPEQLTSSPEQLAEHAPFNASMGGVRPPAHAQGPGVSYGNPGPRPPGPPHVGLDNTEWDSTAPVNASMFTPRPPSAGPGTITSRLSPSQLSSQHDRLATEDLYAELKHLPGLEAPPVFGPGGKPQPTDDSMLQNILKMYGGSQQGQQGPPRSINQWDR